MLVVVSKINQTTKKVLTLILIIHRANNKTGIYSENSPMNINYLPLSTPFRANKVSPVANSNSILDQSMTSTFTSIFINNLTRFFYTLLISKTNRSISSEHRKPGITITTCLVNNQYIFMNIPFMVLTISRHQLLYSKVLKQ